MTTFLLSLLLLAPASAQNAIPATATRPAMYRVPRAVKEDVLLASLRAAGFNVAPDRGTTEENGQLFVVWGDGGESRDPAPYVRAALPTASEQALFDLCQAWDAGTPPTAAQQLLILRALVRRVLGF